ncbi:MAG TPA: SGNH/GDSL hydrolase family protein, partial [Pirellulaceae bacterium]|nr:SGNH/GDSL hydrolase family protein [Pirellulaceae bacterium]
MNVKTCCASLLTLLLVAAAALPLAAQEAKPDVAKFQIPATDDGLPGAGPIRRYDWFRNLWQAKRSGWAGQVKQDQGAVVFLGDSITQGWGDTLGGSFGDLKVANRGISGDTTRGMLIRLEEDVLSLHPRAVVLLMGTNDLEEKAEPQVIADNLKLIIAALKKHNAKLPIILCKVFPSSETKSRPADKIKQINDLYAAAVKGDPQVIVLETWQLFADKDGRAQEAEFPDLLHPNQAGYVKWAAALRPIFATLGYLETEPDDFQNEPGFISLFNGKDLTGWGFRATPAPKGNPAGAKEAITFDGQQASNDGRYVAINGRLVVTTPPEGRRVQQLWTTR